MISIIVPVYKVEPYLRRCVDSLLSQTYKDLEIILVDDGSPDGCPAICDEYAQKDSRIKVLHKENGGQSAARNNALGIATGKYVGFVDSDDWVESDYCETLHNLIHDKDLAICSYNTVFEGKEQVTEAQTQHVIKKLSTDELWDEVFGHLNNAAWNKLYRRDLLQDNPFRLGIYHGEDLLFNLDYISKCKSAAISTAPLYNYVKRAGSVTSGVYTPKKKYEMVSKDMAYEIVSKLHPSLLPIATRYCFRSRLNVLRSIYKSKVEYSEQSTMSECATYLKNNYATHKAFLTMKDKLEYHLYSLCRPLYRIVINKI